MIQDEIRQILAISFALFALHQGGMDAVVALCSKTAERRRLHAERHIQPRHL